MSEAEKPMWQVVIDCQPAEARQGFLKEVLRTRRRAIPIGLNGRVYMVQRGMVRDYLRGLA